MLFLDGNFQSGKKCNYHCSPTCHPLQVGPDLKYGCHHPAWPANKHGDFVPIVACDGSIEKCEVPEKSLKWQRIGLLRRVENAQKKIDSYKRQIGEIDFLLPYIERKTNGRT